MAADRQTTNNMSWFEETGHGSNTAYAVIFGIVALLGLPLNAVSLWILVRHHRLKSPSAVLMINLALSDLLLVLSLPTRVYFYATGTWPLGIQACILAAMVFGNNIRASVIFITFIGVDRLLAVVFPLRARHLRTTANTWRACGLVWILFFVLMIPEHIWYSRTIDTCNLTTCFNFEDFPCFNESVAPQLMHAQSGLVFAFLAVNVISTSLASWKLRSHLSDSVKINNKMNVMLIFVMNVSMFVIFFLPLSVVTSVKDLAHAIPPALCLASVNCCFDPLLYYFSMDSFWKNTRDDESRLKLQPVTRRDIVIETQD